MCPAADTDSKRTENIEKGKDSLENFINKLEEIANRKNVSFSYKIFKGRITDVKGSMLLTNSFGENFQIYFTAEVRFDKNKSKNRTR